MFEIRNTSANAERGAALLIAVAFLILVSWAAFLFGFNTISNDTDVVQLDAMCQTIAKSALQEFPHPLGGFKGLNPAKVLPKEENTTPTTCDEWDQNCSSGASSSQQMSKAYEILHSDLINRTASTFSLMGISNFEFRTWEELENPSANSSKFSPITASDDQLPIFFGFAPINTRSSTNDQGQWNNGVKIRLAKLREPWGIKFSFANSRPDLVQVECEAQLRPADVLLVEDTSAAQGRWTKAGDGGPLQKLCTTDGMRYEEYGANQPSTTPGIGGPKRKADNNVDVYSLCFRMCVSGVAADGRASGVPLDGTGNYINDYMLLAGPAGKQSTDAQGKPIAIPDLTRPAPYQYPYTGQRVVCHTAHSLPDKSHVMLTSAALGQSMYCAPDPNADPNDPNLIYGYHPMCRDSATFFGKKNCAQNRDLNDGPPECRTATSPTNAEKFVPAAKDMLVTERGVIDYITNGLPAADDGSKTAGPHNVRLALATLGGEEDLPNGAIAFEYQADKIYTDTGQPQTRLQEIRLLHFHAYTNFLNALNSMMDARQCVNDYMLKLRLATLAGVNFIEGGTSQCDLEDDDGTPNTSCYKTTWRPAGAGENEGFEVGQNWSSSVFRLALMHYSDVARFSNGDPRTRPGATPLDGNLPPTNMFETLASHGGKYQRPLEKGAMTRNVVQQNALYGCEAWMRKGMWQGVSDPDLEEKIAKPINGVSGDGGIALPFTPPGSHFGPGVTRSILEAPTPAESLSNPQTVFGSLSIVDPQHRTNPIAARRTINNLAKLTTLNSLMNSTPGATPVVATTALKVIEAVETEGGGNTPPKGGHSTNSQVYESPVPGFFRVGPPVTPSEPNFLASEVAGSDPTADYDFNQAILDPAQFEKMKTKTHFVMGWNPGGRRYTLSALELAVIAMEKAPQRDSSGFMSKKSSPEKIIVFNSSGLPTDLECLRRKASDPSAPFDFLALTTEEKATRCRECWNDVKDRLDCAWEGGTMTSGTCDTSNPSYNRKMALYLNLLADDRETSEYCGNFNFVTEMKLLASERDTENQPVAPWLHLNVLKTLDDMINASNVYLFARDFLRSQ